MICCLGQLQKLLPTKNRSYHIVEIQLQQEYNKLDSRS